MKNDRTEMGEVIFVQVQRVPLKQGAPQNKIYDPAGLVRVPEVFLTPSGVVGVTAEGERIVDAHHESHPESRFNGLNGISVGFTAHYDLMRASFGPHLTDGIAGENMIIRSRAAFSAEELQGLLVFVNPDGSECRMRLVKPMAPCNEFSHFARKETGRLPADVLKTTLQDLEGGRRGFALSLTGADSGRVQTGARLFLENA